MYMIFHLNSIYIQLKRWKEVTHPKRIFSLRFSNFTIQYLGVSDPSNGAKW